MYLNIAKLFGKHRFLVLLLGTALVVKLFFAGFAPFRTDMNSWIGWGNQLVEYGIPNFYNSTSWTDYTPGYFYILWLVTWIQKLALPGLSGGALDFYYKLPIILADLACGFLIYRTMLIARAREDHTLKLPLVIAGLYLFNPVTTFNGALWGQADSVHVLLLLLSWYLIARKSLMYSFVFFVLACVVKPLSGLLAPVYLYLLFREKPLQSLKLVGVSIVAFMVATIPFWGLSAPVKLVEQLQSSYELYPYASLNTFNYWGTYGFWVKDNTIQLGEISASGISYAMLALWFVGILALFMAAIKGRSWHQSLPVLSLFGALSVLGGITFMLRIHERYMFPFFAFFVLFLGYLMIKHKSGFTFGKFFVVGVTLYVLQSIVHLANLYYVYVQYLYWKDGGPQVPALNRLYWDIADSTVWWSWAQVVITVAILLYTVWVLFQNKKALLSD